MSINQNLSPSNLSPNSDRVNILNFLKEAKQEGKEIGISGWKLALASKTAESNSLGARLVRYLIGLNFIILTKAVWKALNNQQWDLEKRKGLADNFKHLIETKQRRIALKQIDHPGDEKLKAQAELYRDIFKKIEIFQSQAVNPLRNSALGIAPLADHEALKAASFWTSLKRMMGMIDKADKIKILEYHLNNKETYLPERLNSHANSLPFFDIVHDCVFVKKEQGHSIQELANFYESDIQQGKSVLIYDENKQACLLTPTLQGASYHTDHLTVDLSNLTDAYSGLSGKILSDRRQMFVDADGQQRNHA